MRKLHAYYLLRKTQPPNDVGVEIQEKLSQLEKINNKESYLREAYQFITTRYQSGRIDTVLKLPSLFSASTQDLWDRNGFMHCTNQNYLLALLLVKGKHFEESDIKIRWVLVGYMCPHQYLKVKIGADQWVDVDSWARHYGIGFGDHARGFNTKLLRSFVN